LAVPKAFAHHVQEFPNVKALVRKHPRAPALVPGRTPLRRAGWKRRLGKGELPRNGEQQGAKEAERADCRWHPQSVAEGWAVALLVSTRFVTRQFTVHFQA
jgi:hypothetical protein